MAILASEASALIFQCITANILVTAIKTVLGAITNQLEWQTNAIVDAFELIFGTCSHFVMGYIMFTILLIIVRWTVKMAIASNAWWYARLVVLTKIPIGRRTIWIEREQNSISVCNNVAEMRKWMKGGDNLSQFAVRKGGKLWFSYSTDVYILICFGASDSVSRYCHLRLAYHQPPANEASL